MYQFNLTDKHGTRYKIVLAEDNWNYNKWHISIGAFGDYCDAIIDSRPFCSDSPVELLDAVNNQLTRFCMQRSIAAGCQAHNHAYSPIAYINAFVGDIIKCAMAAVYNKPIEDTTFEVLALV